MEGRRGEKGRIVKSGHGGNGENENVEKRGRKKIGQCGKG